MKNPHTVKIMGLFILTLFSVSLFYSITPITGLESPISDVETNNTVDIGSDVAYERVVAPPFSNLMDPIPDWDFAPNLDRNFGISTNQLTDMNENLVVNIDTDRRTYSPGNSINIVISVTSKFEAVIGARVNVSIYEGDNWWWYVPYYFNFEPPILHDSIILITDQEGQATGSFQVSEEGFYSIQAEVVGNVVQSFFCPECRYASAYKTVQVSDIGVFWRVPMVWTLDEEITSYIVVRETSDFSKPVSNANINITLVTGIWWEEQITETQIYTSVTDDAGLKITKFTISDLKLADDYYSQGYAILSIEKDGKKTQTTQWVSLLTQSTPDYYYGESWPGKYEFVITTDKSVYQPGHSIQTRVLVFENSYYNASRKVAADLPVTIDLIDPEGFHLAHRQRRTDLEGIIAIGFNLDSDAIPGTYRIVYSVGNSESTIEIPVRYYQRPAFRVSIESGRYYQPGQIITGNISAEYYFGQPVKGTYDLRLYLAQEGSGKIIDDVILIPTSGEQDSNEINTITSQDLAKITGNLDGDGFASFSLQLPEELEGYRGIEVILNATVTDVADRKVSTSHSITMSPELYVWAYTEPYNVEVDEEVLLKYFVADGSWWWRGGPSSSDESSVANANIEVKIYSRRENGELGQEVLILSTTADKFGQGELILDIPEEIAGEYRNFIAKITATTADGRVGEGQAWFQYTILDFDITVSQNQINPGDELIVTLGLTNKLTGKPEQAQIRISAYDSDYERIAESQFKLDGSSELTLELTSLAPEGTYHISAWLSDEYTGYGYSPYRTYGWAQATFIVGIPSEIQITPEQEHYNVGEVAVFDIEILSPASDSFLPVYLEVSKRGIVLFMVLTSPVTTLELPLTYAHTPKIYINAFAIGVSGIVLSASSEIQVDFDLTVNIEADKEIYTPRETAKITITVEDGNGNRIPAVTSLVLVDSSVYGVVPDPELETDVFEEDEFYSSMTTKISWLSSQLYYPIWGIVSWGFAEDAVLRQSFEVDADQTVLPPGAAIPKSISTSPFPEVREGEIRKNLPESTVWQPKRIIGRNGELVLEVDLPDNIGEWTIRTITNVQGHGSLDKLTITTFKEFFLEMKHPLFTFQDDTFELQGLLYNYGQDGVAQTTLSFEGEGLAQVVNSPTQLVPIFEGEITIITWYVFSSEPGEIFAISTAAAADGRVDGLQKRMIIKPNAVLFEERFAGIINDTILEYNLSEQSIEHSSHLTIVPGFTGAALEGWKRLIGYPYGCTEQTISRLLPSALVYKYLDETGQLDSDTQTLIEDMIITGISRLYAFNHPDGGWGWWEQDESNVHMTAIVLYGLGTIRELGFNIDTQIINSAITYLLQQQRNGYWEMDRRGWDIGASEVTALVIRAILIASSNDISNELGKNTQLHIEDALNYLEDVWQINPSPYLGGLLGQVLLLTGTHQDLFEQIINYLVNSYNLESNMIFWGDEQEWWYWRALGGPVETTSIVLQMLLEAKLTEYYLLVNQAANWLMTRQNRYGWGTTSDTSAAIHAITTLAKLGGTNIESTIRILENEELVDEFYFNSTSQAERVKLHPQVGLNSIRIEQEGTGIIFYHLEVSSHVRTELIPTYYSTIEVPKGQQFALNIDLRSDETSPVLPVDVQVQIENWDAQLELESPPIVNFELIPSSAIVSFNFTTLEIGEFYINRIWLQYNLANRDDLTQHAPATLSRNYGPILIKVLDQDSLNTATTPIQPDEPQENQTSSPKLQSGLLATTDDTISIKRTYSKYSGIDIGETIKVSIVITNNVGQPLSYLMCEDPLLPWFILDDYSLRVSKISWSKTSEKLTFFIPILEIGDEITIEYNIIATGNVDASAASTSVSTMYSRLEFKGAPSRLRTSGIPQLIFNEGIPVLDISPPTISNVLISNSRPSVTEQIRFSAHVVDDHAVENVVLWYKSELDNSWNSIDMISSEDVIYETELSFDQEGTIYFFLQAHDWVQNTIMTEEDSIFVEDSGRVPLLNPMVGLIGAIVLAVGIILFKNFSRRGRPSG